MFIINLKYIQLINNLIITYVIIFNKDNLINQINVYLGVTIRVRGSGSCRVEPWVIGYMGWPEPNLFSKRVKNPQPEYDMIGWPDPTRLTHLINKSCKG